MDRIWHTIPGILVSAPYAWPLLVNKPGASRETSERSSDVGKDEDMTGRSHRKIFECRI